MRYETSVQIAAEPARVWATWVDVEHWPDWTASVVSVKRLDGGEFGVGSRARVKQPGMSAMTWEVTEAVPTRSFVWTARTAGTRMVAGHYLETDTDGALIARLTFDHAGPLAGLLSKLVGGRIRRYLQMEAEGVKRRAEGEPGQ